MIRTREGRRSNNQNKSKGNNKIVISSRFHFYDPSAISLKVPVVVFEDTTAINFESLKACIISVSHNIMFLMTEHYDYYIVQVNDSFIKMINHYKFVILADNTIYSGKKESNDGIHVPLYINE